MEIRKNEHKILYILAIIIGFFIALIQNFLGNKERMLELILIFPPNCYHIHHYIYFLLLAIFLYIGYKVKNSKIIFSIIFLFIGISLEDLLFNDFTKIKNDCHNTKLIKLLKKEK